MLVKLEKNLVSDQHIELIDFLFLCKNVARYFFITTFLLHLRIESTSIQVVLLFSIESLSDFLYQKKYVKLIKSFSCEQIFEGTNLYKWPDHTWNHNCEKYH